MKSIDIFGVKITSTSKSEALALVSQWLLEYRPVISSRLSVISSKSASFQSTSSKLINRKLIDMKPKTENRKPITGDFPKIIATPNPEMIVAAQKDLRFRQALNSADLAIPDGVGLLLADKRLKIIHGLDFMESLIKEAVKHRWQVVFLGGKPGIAEAASKKLQIKNSLKISNFKFQICGLSGPADIDHASQVEMDHLISQLNSIQPHLLFVAFGHGKQEKWLLANRWRLKAAVAMGVGGALDQIADLSLRPPHTINSMGLGWLYRLIRQPWRWGRQLALIKFIQMVIKEKIKRISSFQLI